MTIGFFIIGFMVGFLMGLGGGHSLAKRNEVKELQNAIRDQTPLDGFKTAKAKQFNPDADYFDSVPNSWRDDA
jgi:hypothetical protein